MNSYLLRWFMLAFLCFTLWFLINLMFAFAYMVLSDQHFAGISPSDGWVAYFYYAVGIGGTVGDAGVMPVTAHSKIMVACQILISVFFFLFTTPLLISFAIRELPRGPGE